MENAWTKYDDKKAVMDFSEDYKHFLNVAKTERESVKESIKLAEAAGFRDFNTVNEIKTGDRVYYNNRGKSLILFVAGEKSEVEGINILGAHIDSPRLDLKAHTVYEDGGLVLLDTHYYGGIKKYQWVTQPLAMHGVVCKKDGSVIELSIGEDENDPVVECSDVLIHLAQNYMTKEAAKVVEGEQLNALAGSIPASGEKDEKELVKKNILSILKEKYNIEEDDFISAEIELVPAGKARDLGLDRGLIMAYGQDDRVCAYTSLKAILDIDNPVRTACCLLVDKEEVGSQGNTGMQSANFCNILAEYMEKRGNYSELNLRRALRNSYCLSSDVTAAFDPNFPDVSETKNTAYFCRGLDLTKYTGSRGKSGSNDANPEFIATLRRIWDDNNVAYQTAELGKVDVGGGGTIAYIMANLDMDVIDVGVPVGNMHSCYETSSKVDVYETYLGYKVFLKEIK